MNRIVTRYFLGKFMRAYIWERIFREKLAEPLHLQLISLLIGTFGSFRAKVYFDLVFRPHHAFALLRAADRARQLGIRTVTSIEFGVAGGYGLLNMGRLAQRIEKVTGVKFRVIGFDTGKGLPPPRDWRDHPDFYRRGEYAMQEHDLLKRSLPDFAELIFGDMVETVPAFLARLDPAAPIGFVSVDVDYYWSAVEALRVFESPDPRQYLKTTYVYLDDIAFEDHSKWAGEMLAVEEFNGRNQMRKICPLTMLRQKRVMKNAQWIDHMHALHVLDHPERQVRE